MRWIEGLVLGAALFGVARAQPAAGPVFVSDGWARPGAAGGEVAGYVTIRNEGVDGDALLRAECAGADTTELRAARDAGPAGPSGGVPIPGHGRVVFGEQTGPSLVLHGLHHAAAVGALLSCTATFRRAGQQIFELTVRDGPFPVVPHP